MNQDDVTSWSNIIWTAYIRSSEGAQSVHRTIHPVLSFVAMPVHPELSFLSANQLKDVAGVALQTPQPFFELVWDERPDQDDKVAYVKRVFCLFIYEVLMVGGGSCNTVLFNALLSGRQYDIMVVHAKLRN